MSAFESLSSGALVRQRELLYLHFWKSKVGAEVFLASLPGFEPRLTGPKPVVLPLHHRLAPVTGHTIGSQHGNSSEGACAAEPVACVCVGARAIV